MQDTSQYHVEHLSTFMMDKAESIVTVDDAVRKLVLLDSKDKIWTQEMLLQVNDKSIKLLDCDSKEVLEDFPLSTVLLSQTVLGQVSRYPSTLMIVCQDPEQNKPDIHFFHCSQVEAEMIHADIDSALGDTKVVDTKKTRPQTLKINQEKLKRQRETIIPANTPKGHQGRVAAVRDIQRRGSEVDSESHENLAQRIEKDVQILNCALDDIEIFVSRLRKAMDAFTQLNMRNKSRKNKKRGPAEGMLTLRAKLPSEVEFVDCLQKLKLSFNLLAKLKKHIQNPSAAELIHFLFGPLELILQTCGSADLAQAILAPHLSRDAVEFLRGHLSPKEANLFQLLGDTWNRPRCDWPQDQCAPLYVPKFLNGWEPPIEVFRSSPWETEGPYPPSSPGGRHSDELFSQSPFSSSNGSAIGRYVKTRYRFVAHNSNELSVMEGEVLEVLENDKTWWKLRNNQGQSGYVSSSILDVVQPGEVHGKAFKSSPSSSSINQAEKGAMDEVNKELLSVIATSKSQPPQRNFQPPHRSPAVACPPLTYDSTPPQVASWLQAKTFSKPTVECLGILTGAQLFSLNKEELKAVCGEEGARVWSQITVQKSQLESNRGDSELQEIMRKRKEKIKE